MRLFTPEDRTRLRDAMIARAETDPQIAGAALVGSAARGTEDAWSDIDLVLQLAADADEEHTVADWTAWMRARDEVSDTMDVFARGGVRYRVFLLASSLQVYVSFWPHDEFRATEPGFRLLFGTPGKPTEPPPAASDADAAIGMGWLYALHARSSIARGRTWQAVQMLDELQRTTLQLAAMRHGLNAWHAREIDRLPAELLDEMAGARATGVDAAELRRSLRALTDAFGREVVQQDPGRAVALEPALRVIGGGAGPGR